MQHSLTMCECCSTVYSIIAATAQHVREQPLDAAEPKLVRHQSSTDYSDAVTIATKLMLKLTTSAQQQCNLQCALRTLCCDVHGQRVNGVTVGVTDMTVTFKAVTSSVTAHTTAAFTTERALHIEDMTNL
jgi:hypothetical protein